MYGDLINFKGKSVQVNEDTQIKEHILTLLNLHNIYVSKLEIFLKSCSPETLNTIENDIKLLKLNIKKIEDEIQTLLNLSM